MKSSKQISKIISSAERISKTLYVIKSFAILSVIVAHMPFTFEHQIAEIIRATLGQIGVAVFFIVSGYYYSRRNGDSKEYWLKKVKTLLVPWGLLSTVVFFLSVFVFGSGNNLLVGFIKNFLGIGTVYWYMTVMAVMLVLFKLFYDKEPVLYICLAVTILSVGLSAFGIIEYSVYFNQYLNVFNWIGFFALGILLRRNNWIERLINPIAAIISLTALVGVTVIAVMRGNVIEAYIDLTSLFVELAGFVVLLNASYVFKNSRLLTDIGKKSFFIYLIHIQIVGFVNTRVPYNTLFFILRPFVGLAACYTVAVLFKLILDKLKLRKYCFVFGLDR